MKIQNLTTNAETITIEGQTAVLAAGGAYDLGPVSVLVRGQAYADSTNLYTLSLTGGGVVATTQVSPNTEFEIGAMLGLVLAPVIITVALIRRHFARGDAFD